MNFQSLVILGIVTWVASLGCCFLSVRFSRSEGRFRRPLAVAMSLLAIALGWLGRSMLRVNATKTVNGVQQWHLDSGWLFAASMGLGAATLLLALWRWRRPAAV